MNTYVFCFDSNYAKYCAVALLSLLISNGNKIKVYCLHDGSAEGDDLSSLEKISEMYGFELNIIPVETSAISTFKTNHHFTTANYIRLLIPDVLRNEDKVLYLDCDLIISKNLSNIFSLDISNILYAGAPDLVGEKTTKIEIKQPGNYINTGVLLMNLKKLRDNNSLINMIKVYDEYADSIIWVDQCLINKYAENEKIIFDETYNYQVFSDKVSRLDWDAIKHKKHIFHFVGRVKPWHKHSRSFVQFFWWSFANLLNKNNLKIVESNQINDLILECQSLEEDYKYEESCQVKSKIIQSLIKNIQISRKT